MTTTPQQDTGQQAPTGRVRLVALTVQPMVVVDDGETLTPAQMKPLTIPAGQAGDVARLVDDAIEQATRSLTQSSPHAAASE